MINNVDFQEVFCFFSVAENFLQMLLSSVGECLSRNGCFYVFGLLEKSLHSEVHLVKQGVYKCCKLSFYIL